MAKKQKPGKPDPILSPALVADVAAEVEETSRKMSGDELKASLRQQRRETRLAEKGY